MRRSVSVPLSKFQFDEPPRHADNGAILPAHHAGPRRWSRCARRDRSERPSTLAPAPTTTSLARVGSTGWCRPASHRVQRVQSSPYHRGLANHHAHTVVDEETSPDGRTGWISIPVSQRPRCDTSLASHLPGQPQPVRESDENIGACSRGKR